MEHKKTVLWSVVSAIVVAVALGALWYAAALQKSSETTTGSLATQTSGYKKLSAFSGVGTLGFDAEIPADWTVVANYNDPLTGTSDLSMGSEENPNLFHVDLTVPAAKSFWEDSCGRDNNSAGCRTTTVDGQTAYMIEPLQGGMSVDALPTNETVKDAIVVKMYIDHPTISASSALAYEGVEGRHYMFELLRKITVADGQSASYTVEVDHFLDTFKFNRVQSADF